MTPGRREAQPLAGGVRDAAAGRPALAARICATRGAARFAALGFPTVARRGVAVHQRGADRARSSSRRPSRCRGAAERLAGFAYTDAPVRLVVVNGRFAPTLSRDQGAARRRRRSARWRPRSTEHADVVAALLRPARRLQQPQLHGAQHRVRAGRRVRPRARRRRSSSTPIHIVFVTGADGATVMAHPRTLIVAGAAQPGADRRELRRRRRARPTSPTP